MTPVTPEEPSAKSHAVLVVGVDFTDVSEHLVKTVRSLIRTVDEAELHFVHVVHPPRTTLLAADALGAAMQREVDSLNAARREIVRMCGALAGDAGVQVFAHTPVGDACESLAEIAGRLRADLVVVEAHDHSQQSALTRVFRRSTVGRLARSAPCSVLTVRAPG